MKQYNTIPSEARPKTGRSLSFVGLLPDTLLTMAVAQRPELARNTGDLCASAVLGSLKANWRTGEVSLHERQEVRQLLGMGRWRWRKVRTLGAEQDIWKDSRTIRLDKFAHQKGRPGEPHFVPVDRRTIFEVIKQWSLTPLAIKVYINLALRQWAHRGEEHTLTKLASELHLAHRSLKAALVELAGSGLCQYGFRQGARGRVHVDVDLLRASTSEYYPEGKRSQSRSEELAVELWHALDRTDTPPVLARHVARLLEAGLAEEELVERVVAMGSLDQARNPLGVVIKRLKVIGSEIRKASSAPKRREYQPLVVEPMDVEQDPIQQRYRAIRDELGVKRLGELERILAAKHRRDHGGGVVLKHILTLDWADQQQASLVESYESFLSAHDNGL